MVSVLNPDSRQAQNLDQKAGEGMENKQILKNQDAGQKKTEKY